MIWTIITLAVVFFLIKFLMEVIKDKDDLREETLAEKLNVIIEAINEAIFSGRTKINFKNINIKQENYV